MRVTGGDRGGLGGTEGGSGGDREALGALWGVLGGALGDSGRHWEILGGIGRHWEILGGTWGGLGGHWEALGGTGEGTGRYWEGMAGHWEILGGTWGGLGGQWEALGGYWLSSWQGDPSCPPHLAPRSTHNWHQQVQGPSGGFREAGLAGVKLTSVLLPPNAGPKRAIMPTRTPWSWRRRWSPLPCSRSPSHPPSFLLSLCFPLLRWAFSRGPSALASPVCGGSPTSPRHHHLLIFSLPTCGTCFSALGTGVHVDIRPQERSRGATFPTQQSPHLVGEADVPGPRGMLTCSRHGGIPTGCLGPSHVPSHPPGSC